MFTYEVNDIHDLLYTACSETLRFGKNVNVRGKDTYELHPALFKIFNPLKRTLLYPCRGNNPFATLYETLWVLFSKTNNIEMLSKFLPRATEYSDDGTHWRAGYAERLRAHGVHHDLVAFGQGVDQIRYVYEKLRTDPSSRQAVITLWSPKRDCFKWHNNKEHGYELKESRDFPCSNYLTFVIRDGKLDCTFVMRSNDVVFGMTGINFYEFSVLQEILARLLGVGIGDFYYFINSLHIYKEHVPKAEKILAQNEHVNTLSVTPDQKTIAYGVPVFEFWDSVCCADGFFEYFRNGADVWNSICNGAEKLYYAEGIVFWEDTFNLLQIFLRYKNLDSSQALESYCKDMKLVQMSDLKWACHFWFLKHWKMTDVTDVKYAYKHCLEYCQC